jgi:hypothetical protein
MWMNIVSCEIWGSHSSGYEEFYLLGLQSVITQKTEVFNIVSRSYVMMNSVSHQQQGSLNHKMPTAKHRFATAVYTAGNTISSYKWYMENIKENFQYRMCT